MNVSARDKATGKEQKITISGAGSLDKSEVERMVQEAEQNAAKDAEIREKAETRNHADQAVYQTEKLLKDLGDKVPADEKTTTETAIADVKSALEGDDSEKIKSATETLVQASYKLSEILYKQAEGGETPGAETNGFHSGETPEGAQAQGKPHEDVIDAEFKSE